MSVSLIANLTLVSEHLKSSQHGMGLGRLSLASVSAPESESFWSSIFELQQAIEIGVFTSM